MSFINWGHESPEQLKARREMEERMMFEQMSYSAAVSAAATAGGSLNLLNGLYGVGADGLIYSLGRGEVNWPFDSESFPSSTVITLNTDDDCLYAAVDFDGEVFFIKIDKTTRELTFFDNDISDYVTKGASSLYYEGAGSFIYLDNFVKKSDVSSIIRVTLGVNLEGPFAYSTEVSEVDSIERGYMLRNLFMYDETPWAIAYAGPTVIIGPFDIDAGDFVYSNTLLPSPSDTRVEEIFAVLSTVEYKGTVYSAIVFADSELDGDINIGLFKVDTETGGALAPYYISFVKDLNLAGHGDVPVISIFSY
ncbi:hypothetical protein UFOVP972_188 [uncultured Caudovirales phage]|uniref:Uncharacterized protein n=1 Tax=uncultured Caudovirales phage TaxID=2100421 RepID=A0A6J5Q784_9CAUD|nr:hypothetical protein UFOVP972_188 [uncultured Caudovirales phage]